MSRRGILPGLVQRRPSRARRVRLARETAVLDGQGRRQCAQCGDFIDPVDWCPYCQRGRKACGQPHKSLRKRADAAFCDDACRSYRRSSYIRDCT